MYVMPENIAGDPNGYIECLQRTLKDIEAKEGKLPPVLYFQVIFAVALRHLMIVCEGGQLRS
jgi:hypothetical protein